MIINLLTNVAASYALYQGLPTLKRRYGTMEGTAEGSGVKRVYTFIHLYLEPTSYTAKKFCKSIEENQWVAHLIYYGLIATKTYVNPNPVKLYLKVSAVTALVLEGRKELLPQFIGMGKEFFQDSLYKVKRIVEHQFFLYVTRDFRACLDELFGK